MKNIVKLVSAVIVAFSVNLVGAQQQGDSSDAIQNRMKERVSSINAMKQSGKIGEDNKGYIGVVSDSLSDSEKSTLNSENSDRKSVYAAIAKKQNSTTELVGMRRAIQNAERAKKGEYIMDKDGAWKKK